MDVVQRFDSFYFNYHLALNQKIDSISGIAFLTLIYNRKGYLLFN